MARRTETLSSRTPPTPHTVINHTNLTRSSPASHSEHRGSVSAPTPRAEREDLVTLAPKQAPPRGPRLLLAHDLPQRAAALDVRSSALSGRSGRGADSTSLSAAPRWMAPSKPDGIAGAFALGMGGGGGFFFGGDGCAAVFGIGGGGEPSAAWAAAAASCARFVVGRATPRCRRRCRPIQTDPDAFRHLGRATACLGTPRAAAREARVVFRFPSGRRVVDGRWRDDGGGVSGISMDGRLLARRWRNRRALHWRRLSSAIRGGASTFGTGFLSLLGSAFRRRRRSSRSSWRLLFNSSIFRSSS